MIYLILAIVSSALVSIVMRVSGKYVRGNYGILAVNYVICATMAAFLSGVTNLFPGIEGSAFTLALGVVTGFFLFSRITFDKN